ncbi:hypothetical protein RA282_31200, partial [Pseudomonas syringae pv. tagetis]
VITVACNIFNGAVCQSAQTFEVMTVFATLGARGTIAQLTGEWRESGAVNGLRRNKLFLAGTYSCRGGAFLDGR